MVRFHEGWKMYAFLAALTVVLSGPCAWPGPGSEVLALDVPAGFGETSGLPVYLLIEIEVKDWGIYSKYVERVPEIIEKYGGKYLVRGGKVIPLTGNWNPERVILLEFPSMGQLRKCFQSPEYLELAPLREQSTVSRSIIVESSGPQSP